MVVCVNWVTNRHCQNKLLDTKKVTRVILLRQESAKSLRAGTTLYKTFLDVKTFLEAVDVC